MTHRVVSGMPGHHSPHTKSDLRERQHLRMKIRHAVLAVLLGPIRAWNYLLAHGLTAAVVAHCFSRHWRLPHALFATAAAQGACQVASIAMARLVLGQDVLQLIVVNMGMMCDKIAANVGVPGVSFTAPVLYGLVVFSLAFRCT